MGCAVACVAARCGITYSQALRLFEKEEFAWTRGYYCPEVVAALARAGLLSYSYVAFRASKHAGVLESPGTVAFLAPSSRYPAGHYVLRVKDGWMNPWVNFPLINPARAALVKELEGKVAYVIFAESPAAE